MKTANVSISKRRLLGPLKALIVACITGDGHLQHKGWRHLVSFYSKNMDEINLQRRIFKRVFGINGRLYPPSTNSNAHKLFFISKEVTKELVNLGTPVGNKTMNSFLVPKWVINGNNSIKSHYLRGLYTCEGSVHKWRNYDRWVIAIKMYKHEGLEENGFAFMEQLRSMLKDFQIITSPVRTEKGLYKKDGSISVGFRFDINPPSFRNFYKWVGFYSKEKQLKLITALREKSLSPRSDSQAANY